MENHSKGKWEILDVKNILSYCSFDGRFPVEEVFVHHFDGDIWLKLLGLASCLRSFGDFEVPFELWSYNLIALIIFK